MIFSMECFKCGTSGEKVRLFDAISDEGIIKICEYCANEEDLPVIKRPTTEQLKTAESNTSVRKMLTRMSSGRAALDEEYQKDKKRLEKQEISLRDLVDRNYKDTPKKSIPRPDLVDNFHWVIMRARRSRKVSYKQLAEAISESEAAVQMAEKGILPEDDNKLINKLETYFGVRLVKDPFRNRVPPRESFRSEIKRTPPARLRFDPYTTKTLTISDLQEMKRKREAKEKVLGKEGYSEDIEFGEGVEDVDIEDNTSSGDISKEEMDRILYGRD